MQHTGEVRYKGGGIVEKADDYRDGQRNQHNQGNDEQNIMADQAPQCHHNPHNNEEADQPLDGQWKQPDKSAVTRKEQVVPAHFLVASLAGVSESTKARTLLSVSIN